MIALTAGFSVLALAAQVPQQVDSIRALASDGPDSVLVERARRRPDDARAALRQLLAAGAGGDSAAVAALTSAGRLADAFATAWRDSFLVRQVARFRSLSPADRQAKLSADSVFRVGNEARQTAGIDAAMLAFRDGLRRYEAQAETSGIASALNSIGAMFAFAQDNDSAEAYFTRSRDLAERIGNYQTLANAIGNLGNMSLRRGDLRRASELYASTQPIRERIGDAGGLARDQGNLGVLTQHLGDLVAARRAFETSLAAARRSGELVAAGTALQNLATLDEWKGDYGRATARTREALAILGESGNQPKVAEALFELGRLAKRRGEFPAAMTTLTEAAGMMRRVGPGPTITEIDVRVELANVRAAMGDLQGALTELKRAEGVASRQRGGTWVRAQAVLAEARGDLALRFNRFAEAERQYARARRLAPDAGDPEMEFRTQVGLTTVLYLTGSYQRAQAALEHALLEGPSVQSAARVRLMLGQAALRRGDTATARRAFGHALDTLRALSVAEGEAETLGRLGDLEAGAGRPLAAESLYQHGLARLGTRPAPAVAWQLHAGLAASLRRRGALAEAAAELRAAIEQIERVAGTAPLEHRSAFQADKWDPYVELALIERTRERTEAAFEASERLRARQMLDLLARGRVAPPSAAGDLVSQEQDLRRRIAELTRQLEGPQQGEPGMRDAAQPEGAASAAVEALAQAQDAYAELLVQMREANPAYAALVRGEIAPAREVMSTLAPDEALLEYLVGDSTTIVFVVTSDSVAALDLKLTHDALAALVDFARSALASPREGAARRAWRAPLRRLYQQLVWPVEASGLLAGKRRVLIAPHAELHYLPFAALVRPGPPEQLLIERYVLEYVPSASVWLRLRERPTAPERGGVLALAPRADALPGSRAEVAAIQRTYGDRARTLVGVPATEAAFRGLAPEQEIVHLATYGVLNKHNPLFSFVELRTGGGEDGRLEVHEVFGLTLTARLLVLSACQTGVGAGVLSDVPPGDDWIGLVQGFLYAGAGNVLATLWPVSDLPTARLMEQFYEELATGQPEVEALARAQRAALRRPTTAHPFYWAGFTLVRGR